MARRDLTGAIDLAALEAYAGGDPELVEEVLGLFQQQVELWMRLLEGAEEADGYRDAAHTLKGAALGLCAADLAAACARAEAEAEADTWRRDRLAAAVRDAVDRVLADAAAWRHEHALRSLRKPSRHV